MTRHDATTGFDFAARTRILFGAGTADRLGELAAELGCRRILVVSDEGVAAAGHLDRAFMALEDAGLRAVAYTGVAGNPTSADVERCAEAARAAELEIDGILGIGGGSSLDTAKGANFVLTQGGGPMNRFRGYGKAGRPMLPMIAVPTTAGTGSEVQSYALVADTDTHEKMACGDPKAAPRVAVLDPRLTVTMPHRVTALTAMDALSHAIETAVTKTCNPLSTTFSREAFRRMIAALPNVLIDPDGIDARADALLGACFAGLAIESSMLGAAHAAANPLTARFDVEHGQAVGVMLPAVIRWNAADRALAEAYRDLMIAADLGRSDEDPFDSAEALAVLVESLARTAKLATSLVELDVPEAALPELAADAATQWTGTHNPRPAEARDFEDLYRATFSRKEATAP